MTLQNKHGRGSWSQTLQRDVTVVDSVTGFDFEVAKGNTDMSKKRVILIDVVLSGLAQGLDKDVIINSLPSVLLKGTAMQDDNIRECYDIEIISILEEQSPEEYIPNLAMQDDVLMVGFSVYTLNYLHVRQASELLKQLAPHIKIVWGGPQVSYNPIEQLNQSSADYIICGPGETAFWRLLLSLIGRDDMYSIPTLTYRDLNDKVQQVPGEFYVEDLRNKPSPFQNGLIDLTKEGKHAVYLETFRGCPKSCGYCVWGATLGKMQFYPLDSILKDIEYIYSFPTVLNVYVTDACLFYNPKRAITILKKINEVNVHNISTFLELDPMALKPEYIPYLKPVCQSDYRLGVQSFNEDALLTANRGKRGFDLLQKKVNMLRREDPDARISFALIYGLPDDSLDDFRETLSFTLTLKPDSVKINALSVLPGSDYWKRHETLQIEFEEDPPHRILHSKDFSSDDLRSCELLSAWMIYFLRFKLLKDVIYTMIDRAVLPNPIEFIDKLIERLSPIETWMDTQSQKLSLTVEEENERRMFIINQSGNPECKLNLYNNLVALLTEYEQLDLVRLIQDDLDYFENHNQFFDFHVDEVWKR